MNVNPGNRVQRSRGHGPGGGGPVANMGGAKAKNFGWTMRLFLGRMKPFTGIFVIAFLFAVASTVFSILGPDIMRTATNEIADGVVGQLTGSRPEGIDFGIVGGVVVTLCVLYLLGALFSVVMNFLLVNVSQKVTYELRKDISEKLNRMPLKYFDSVPHGEVLSRVTNDVDTIGQSLSQSLSQSITSVVQVFGVLVMMFRISWQMTLVALVSVPLSLALVSVIVKNSQKYFRKQQSQLGVVNGLVEETYGGHTVIKAFNAEKAQTEAFAKENEALFDSAWKSQFFSISMFPAMNFIGNISYVAVCVLGGFLVINKTILMGDILAFIQYVRSFTQPISQVAQIANVIQSTAAAAERVFEFMAEEEEPADSANPANTANVTGGVSFEHIKFGYNPDQPIIHDFTADVAQGKRIAIVGPTGAGKTTIVKLLMRYYDLNGGKILIDGTNITDFTRQDLRGLVAMVLQDAWLFNGSIRENIRYGNLNATDDEVTRAAKAAHVHHFIRTLPGGYDMELNEEAGNISQGQKQLLTIARAILSSPKILILDEATSSVDTRTEVLIQQAMEELMKGRTSFIIAHRLSTIRNADLILVMNNGDIIEQGSHEALLSANGFYANLYNSQFEA